MIRLVHNGFVLLHFKITYFYSATNKNVNNNMSTRQQRKTHKYQQDNKQKTHACQQDNKEKNT